MLARTLWLLASPLRVKPGVAVVLLAASQYHFWSRLSSGSVFAPEFFRGVVIAFNWTFGTILGLAILQVPIDPGTSAVVAARRDSIGISDGVRCSATVLAAALAAIGVANAVRIPPIEDVDVAIRDLPPQFEGYRLLQPTDLHISRLSRRHGPAPWSSAPTVRGSI